MNNLEQPPKTIEEVGIHLFYMTKEVGDLKKAVEESTHNYATNDTVSEIDTRVKRLETRNIVKDTLLWVGLVASAIINIILVYNLFGGGK